MRDDVITAGGWSSLNVTGQAPPPCSGFTLTTVGEKRAAMYGGVDGSSRLNHLFIVELGGHSVVSVYSHEILSFVVPLKVVYTTCKSDFVGCNNNETLNLHVG